MSETNQPENEDITSRMHLLGIYEEDLEERFIKGSGAGGQKINKTSSCVYLKHLPTGIEIKCQTSRSQSANRSEARRELCDHMDEANEKQRQAKMKKRASTRFQKRKRSRRQKNKILDAKRKQGTKKRLRRNDCSKDL